MARRQPECGAIRVHASKGPGVRRFVRAVALTALIFVACTFLLLGTAVTWPHLAPRATPVADRFQPPADWELVVDNDEGASLFCLGGNPCPSVHRAWVAASDSVTPALVASLGERAGWHWVVKGDCEMTDDDAARFNLTTTCSARADTDGYAVACRVTAYAADPEHVRVTLSVRPLNPRPPKR
jgi:hypothetical protein